MIILSTKTNMKKIAIIGSGISALIVAKVFLKAKYKVYMFDSGNFNNKSNKAKNKKDTFKLLSSKFLQDKFANEINRFKKKYKILNNDFNLKSALVSGGLSNYWGAGIEYPSYDYLKKYSNYKSIIKENREIKKIIGIPFDDDTKYFDFFYKQNVIQNILIKRNKKIFFEKSNLAVRQIDIKDQIKKNTIFNASSQIKILKKNKYFYYYGNKHVVSFKRCKKNAYKIIFEQGESDSIFDKVIISAGTIGSSILVGKLLNLKTKIKVLHHKMLVFIFFAFKNMHRSLKGYDLPLLRLVYKSKFGASKGGFIFSKDLDNRFFNIDNKNFLFNYLKKFFFIGNFFMPTNFTNSYIKLDGNKTKIITSTNKKPMNLYKKKLTEELSNLLKFNKIFGLPIKKSFFLQNGSDAHYTSSLLYLRKNNKKIINNKSEIIGYKNLHVIDGSIIKPGISFPTYFIMLYSSYLSKQILKNEKNKNFN